LKSSVTSSEQSTKQGSPLHLAKKRFGQNFLHDQALIEKIILAIAPKPGDVMVEIGPGQAALTRPLIGRLGHLHAIEIDRDLAARLRSEWTDQQLTLHEQDVLRFDFTALSQKIGRPLRIVGNLPYNISSPILFHLLDHAAVIVDQHVMLQKEVVDRMVAPCGSKIYGRLSVMLQARYRMQKCLSVPPGAFVPAPKVDSAIVRMIPIPESEVRVRDWVVFAAVVMMAFSQRRKMLRNTLSGYEGKIDWSGLGIEPTQRAEELSVDQMIDLANSLI
jgi:16S rRNA (adenine1518-N6/adenine1519-N6)-dimethyltransferase